jgi:hypothetical protein
MIVDIAFVAVPTILGFGAAGLIGSAAIRTAKDVMNSISMLKNLGPAIYLGNILREEVAVRMKESKHKWFRYAGHALDPGPLLKSHLRKGKDTQGKQKEQGGGGSGGSPPSPPDIKEEGIIIGHHEFLREMAESDKKEKQK